MPMRGPFRSLGWRGAVYAIATLATMPSIARIAMRTTSSDTAASVPASRTLIWVAIWTQLLSEVVMVAGREIGQPICGVSPGRTAPPADGRGHLGWTDDDLRTGITAVISQSYRWT